MSSPSDSTRALLRNLAVAAPFYDADYRHMRGDLDLYVRLGQAAAGSVLEVGCGTGRVLEALHRAGIPCHGIDLSPAMLERAAARFGGMEVAANPRLSCMDMCDLALPRQDHGLAILASNTFMHLTTRPRQIKALTAIARHLRPAGRLVMEILNPAIHVDWRDQGTVSEDSWSGQDGAVVTKWLRWTIDWTRQLMTLFITYETLHADSRLQPADCAFELRFLWHGEAALLLERCGFRLLQTWGSHEGAPLDDDSPSIILLAERR